MKQHSVLQTIRDYFALLTLRKIAPVVDVPMVEAALKEDDWLLYCASNHGSLSYDTWWDTSVFYDKIASKLQIDHPETMVPDKIKVGQILQQMIEREGIIVEVRNQQLVRVELCV